MGRKELAVEPHQMEGTAVQVSSYSQPHVLETRMLEKEMTHAETVVGDLNCVRIEVGVDAVTGCSNVPIIYFCPLQGIEVKKRVSSGDRGPLPCERVTLEGIALPEVVGGLYNLKNVIISSNGTLQLKATRKTAWELVNR